MRILRIACTLSGRKPYHRRMSQASPTLRHPPKPRLTVRVGVTGHRPNKLGGEAAARVQRQLPLVYAAIEDVAARIFRENAAYFADEPPAIRLVCGFAEGVDQMAVAACPAGWQIEALLPFPEEEYLQGLPAVGDRRRPRRHRCVCRQPEEGRDRHATARSPAARPEQVLCGCRRLPAAPGRRADRGVGRRAAQARRHRRDRARGIRRRHSGGLAADDRRPHAAPHHRLRRSRAIRWRPMPTVPTDRWPARCCRCSPRRRRPRWTTRADRRATACERFLAERWRRPVLSFPPTTCCSGSPAAAGRVRSFARRPSSCAAPSGTRSSPPLRMPTICVRDCAMSCCRGSSGPTRSRCTSRISIAAPMCRPICCRRSRCSSRSAACSSMAGSDPLRAKVLLVALELLVIGVILAHGADRPAGCSGMSAGSTIARWRRTCATAGSWRSSANSAASTARRRAASRASRRGFSGTSAPPCARSACRTPCSTAPINGGC